VLDVTVNILRGNVKDKDEHLNVLENVFTLGLEVLLHKHVLTTTVPKGEHKVSEETDSMLVYVDCKSNAIGVARQIVGEDDTSHRSLASAHAAHQQNLFDFIGLSRRVSWLLHISWIHFFILKY
jgi:hypothetical protein